MIIKKIKKFIKKILAKFFGWLFSTALAITIGFLLLGYLDSYHDYSTWTPPKKKEFAQLTKPAKREYLLFQNSIRDEISAIELIICVDNKKVYYKNIKNKKTINNIKNTLIKKSTLLKDTQFPYNLECYITLHTSTGLYSFFVRMSEKLRIDKMNKENKVSEITPYGFYNFSVKNVFDKCYKEKTEVFDSNSYVNIYPCFEDYLVTDETADIMALINLWAIYNFDLYFEIKNLLDNGKMEELYVADE